MIEYLLKWIRDYGQDLLDWLKENGEDIILELKDLALDLFELLLEGIVFVISVVAPPEFLSNSLNSISAAMSPALLYFLSMTGIADGIQIIGGAIMFRLIRKISTLGMW